MDKFLAIVTGEIQEQLPIQVSAAGTGRIIATDDNGKLHKSLLPKEVPSMGKVYYFSSFRG